MPHHAIVADQAVNAFLQDRVVQFHRADNRAVPHFRSTEQVNLVSVSGLSFSDVLKVVTPLWRNRFRRFQKLKILGFEVGQIGTVDRSQLTLIGWGAVGRRLHHLYLTHRT